MSLSDLTSNCLAEMIDGADIKDPIVQITQMKRMAPENVARFKVALTDGINMQVALANNAAAESIVPFGVADVYSIIKLTNYTYSQVNEKKVMIIIEFDLMMPGNKINRSLYQDPLASSSPERAEIFASAPKPLVSQPTNKPASNQQVSSSRPVVRTGNSGNQGQQVKNVVPIDSLTPYQNKWCIKAKVTDKKPVRNYKNARGEGKLFSVDLTDKSGQIRATGFTQECDRFYDQLVVGQFYWIRGGQIKAANKQWSSINNDYELTFSGETQIETCHEESVDVIADVFNFVKFNKIADRPKDGLIDIIGVVDTVGQIEEITSRQTQRDFKKRTIKLIDDSKCSVSFTLWGNEAETFDNLLTPGNNHPILAAKGVRIGEFLNSLQLSLTMGGKLIMNPEHEQAYFLRTWFDKEGAQCTYQNLSAAGQVGAAGTGGNVLTLIGVADAERLGVSEKPDYFTVKATISALKRENCLYKACPSADCNKKVQDGETYRCEKCNKEYSSFKWRLMLSAQVTDFSGQCWVTFFEDTASVILGHDAAELGDLKKRDEEAFNIELNKSLFKTFIMKLRAKMETYNDESRVKYSCVKVEKMKYHEYVRHLDAELKKLRALPAPY